MSINLNKGEIFMKRKYEKPMAFEEVFAAENYCTTACYKIACAIRSHPNPPDHWENPLYSSARKDHLGYKGSGCINSNLNRILVNSDGTLKSVEEKSEYGGGANGGNDWMAGGFDYANGPLKPGTTVYWHTTRDNGSRGWNHYGVIEAADSSHPNHS